MTPTEKAAQEAALAVAEIIEQARSAIYGGEAGQDKIIRGAEGLAPVIKHHLAQLQAELDRKDKLLEEARQWVRDGMQSCGCENSNDGNLCTTCTDQQDWLARSAKE